MPIAIPTFSELLRRAAPDADAHMAVDPLSLPMHLLVFVGGSLVALAFAVTNFEYDAPTLNGLLFALVTLAACGIGLRRFGYPAIGTALEITTLMAAFSAAAAFASLILAGTALPYADDWLIKADAVLFFGFDWHSLILLLRGQDELLSFASQIYATLGWQPTLLVVMLLATNRTRTTWTFATAWAICLAFTIAIFPLVPALGGYLHFGIQPSDVPGVLVAAAWRQGELLEPVRNGTLRFLTSGTLGGIVCFPSFHAAAAVLLGWGFSRARWLGWPFVVLNVAMFFSAIVIGGHYLVDVVAGGLLAVLSLLIASRLLVASGRPRRGKCGQAPNVVEAGSLGLPVLP